MAFLGVYGAHATGKTTNLMALWNMIGPYWNPLNPVSMVFADNSAREYRYDSYGDKSEWAVPGPNRWKKDTPGKLALVDQAVADDGQIWIVESVRFDIHNGLAQIIDRYGGGAHIILLIWSDWTQFLRVMQKRCEENNKPFRSDYWDQQKLSYEAFSRFMNQVQKSLVPNNIPHTVYTMDAEYKTWQNILGDIRALVDRPMEDWYTV